MTMWHCCKILNCPSLDCELLVGKVYVESIATFQYPEESIDRVGLQYRLEKEKKGWESFFLKVAGLCITFSLFRSIYHIVPWFLPWSGLPVVWSIFLHLSSLNGISNFAQIVNPFVHMAHVVQGNIQSEKLSWFPWGSWPLPSLVSNSLWFINRWKLHLS